MSITAWSPDAAGAIVADLEEAQASLERALARLRQRTVPPLQALPPTSVAAVQGALALADDAEAACADAVARIGVVQTSIGLAGWSYATTESIVQGVFDLVADATATAVGGGLRIAAMLGLAGAASVSVLLLGPLLALTARDPRLLAALAAGAGGAAGTIFQGLRTLLQQHGPDLVNDPAFLDALAVAIDRLDEVGAGVVGLPGSTLPDDQTIGIAASATMLLSLLLTGRAPRLPGAVPVRVEPSASGAAPDRVPVDSYGSAFDRIQSMESNVEIDRYVLADGTVTWQVFAGGTESFAFDDPDTAYDMTSNVENATNVEGGPAMGSAAAVELAMEAAGVEQGDTVQMFGYSQGGAAVAGAAANGRFRTDSVVTFGAPVGATAVPEGTTAVAVQNDSDVVAHLGGTHGPDRLVLEGSPDLDAIETDRYDPAGQPLADVAAGGHHPEAYAETVAEIDALGDSVVDEVWSVPPRQAGLGPIEVESTGWSVER